MKLENLEHSSIWCWFNALFPNMAKFVVKCRPSVFFYQSMQMYRWFVCCVWARDLYEIRHWTSCRMLVHFSRPILFLSPRRTGRLPIVHSHGPFGKYNPCHVEVQWPGYCPPNPWFPISFTLVSDRIVPSFLWDCVLIYMSLSLAGIHHMNTSWMLGKQKPKKGDNVSRTVLSTVFLYILFF